MNLRSGFLYKFTSFLFILFLVVSCSKSKSFEERKEELILELHEMVNSDSLKANVVWLQQKGTRFALADNRREIAVSIQRRFQSYGIPEVRLDSFMIYRTYRDIYYELWEYNVIAIIQGSENPEIVYILGGHYDSILREGDPWAGAPGANDNASGVAATLEVARVLSDNDFKPKNTIEFIAFGCEELGLYGSKDYAAKSSGLYKNIALMLNNDMIAFEPSSDPNSWNLNILDYENSISSRVYAEDIADKYTSLITFNNNALNQYSDSYPFAQHGYKALFFHNAAQDPNYHTVDDLSLNCNFEYCREVSLISLAILVDKNF